ncbi:MAG TPA: glycine zipper 2TM domain-containing protein [Burkholderiales bacterium]|nr:glycine zipper 2TM domain-containing protein [Burkholderiales bacterium]
MSTSPIVAIAAGSVIVFSLVGVGVMTGVIPSSRSQNVEATQPPAVQPPAAATNGLAPREKPATTPSRRASEPVRVAAAKPARSAAAHVCSECGTVSDIRVIEQKGEGSGLGAVAGGVVGGLLGNQVGGGNGRTIATVAGAAGGAFAGHQVEKKMKSTTHYEVSVRMDDGAIRHFNYEAQPQFQPGDKVKVVDGRLVS